MNAQHTITQIGVKRKLNCKKLESTLACSFVSILRFWLLVQGEERVFIQDVLCLNKSNWWMDNYENQIVHTVTSTFSEK